MNKALFDASCRTFHRLNNANCPKYHDVQEADRAFYEFTKAAILSIRACKAAGIPC